MSLLRVPSVGLELELPVASRHDGSDADARAALRTLFARRQQGEISTEWLAGEDGNFIGVRSPWGLSGIDNGFNNLETAFDPLIVRHDQALNRLARVVSTELAELSEALESVDAFIVNLAEHPLAGTAQARYARLRGPRRIYDHWVDTRGWNHAAGIDAKAQNGPTTGISPADAVEALNLVLLAAPAFIALHANSPFENGRATGYKENRLRLWPRMFASAKNPADLRLCVPPTAAFEDLGDYFRWMFAPDTQMHAIPLDGMDYKRSTRLAEVEGQVCLLEFLAGGPRTARCTHEGTLHTVQPSLHHLEHMQFAQFLDARVRFELVHFPPASTFLDALKQPGGIEALFSDIARFCYIEGRAAGNTLADMTLLEEAGEDVGAAAALSASALQKGLLNAPEAWRRLSNAVAWPLIPGLREAAMRDGLQGTHGGMSVRALCEHVLALAESGLPHSEQWMLGYARHVLNTNTSAADHALRFVKCFDGNQRDALAALVMHRRLVLTTPPVKTETE